MRKLFYSAMAILVLGSSLSSCGLFRGGKSERCPAYSAVSTEADADIAFSQENPAQK